MSSSSSHDERPARMQTEKKPKTNGVAREIAPCRAARIASALAVLMVKQHPPRSPGRDRRGASRRIGTGDRTRSRASDQAWHHRRVHHLAGRHAFPGGGRSRTRTVDVRLAGAGRVRSAPRIDNRITTEESIHGRVTRQEAQDLALILRAGALPVPLTYLEERTIGPSLGADSIGRGVTASIVGLLLVIGFMLAYYKLSGINAAVALIFNLVVLLGLMAYIGAVMTLPGQSAASRSRCRLGWCRTCSRPRSCRRHCLKWLLPGSSGRRCRFDATLRCAR
jgi:protein-export membrane protein SecD